MSDSPATPQAYRKLPVVIQALRWTGDNLRDVIAFTGRHESADAWTWEYFEEVVRTKGLKIFTLEGQHMASVGDYIIRGVKGEHYPCKPDIFWQTYEATDSHSVSAVATDEGYPGIAHDLETLRAALQLIADQATPYMESTGYAMRGIARRALDSRVSPLAVANKVLCPYCNPLPAPDASEPMVPNGEVGTLMLGGSPLRDNTDAAPQRRNPVGHPPANGEMTSYSAAAAPIKATVWGPEQQNYPGGPIYRLGNSTDVSLPATETRNLEGVTGDEMDKGAERAAALTRAMATASGYGSNSQTETPRTDAALADAKSWLCSVPVPFMEFARQLERELSGAGRNIVVLNDLIRVLKDSRSTVANNEQSEAGIRDALDHIMRVARQGIQPTRRLDWIEIRARYALEGKAWSQDIRETPRDSVRKLERDFAKCREELAEALSRSATSTVAKCEAGCPTCGALPTVATGETPRTDALMLMGEEPNNEELSHRWARHINKLYKHARQLERELSDERTRADIWRGNAKAVEQEANDLRSAIAVIEPYEAALEQLCKALDVEIASPSLGTAPPQIKAYADRLRGAEANSIRYIWLRSHSWVDTSLIKSVLNFGPGYQQTNPEVLDAVVDEKMSRSDSRQA